MVLVMVNGGRSADVVTDVIDVFDNTFAQEAFCNGDGGTFFTEDCLVIATALVRLSNTVPTSAPEFVILVRVLVDDLEDFWKATAKVDGKFSGEWSMFHYSIVDQ